MDEPSDVGRSNVTAAMLVLLFVWVVGILVGLIAGLVL
jgi:hypothetical protein